MTAQPQPNLFIVGQPKSGTSAVFSFLRQHPEINACSAKEPSFFCSDIRSQYFHLSKQARTLKNYLALYRSGDYRYWLEGSTAYLYSAKAAEEIHQFNPDARIIILLREPAEFLFTYHKQLLRNSCPFEEVTSLEDALALEPQRRRGEKLPRHVFDASFLYYSERLRYVDHIKRFTALFPVSQIKIVIYDDFKADNAQVMGGLWDWLGLTPPAAMELQQVNAQVEVRNRRLKQFLDKRLFGVKQILRKRIGKRIFKVLRAGYRKIIFAGAVQEKLDPALAQKIRARYVNEVEALSDYLGRDLVSEWGYANFSASAKSAAKAEPMSLSN
ncbi:sulfotransferase family protein [Teredinibacter turnerae]|uniref:sulfotransferase family protein n=1 Tax=Teredinibacter turnerae TaxID=2426 RepID=UPI00037507A0|nr:sulfotransferase [Teredinibacter turnerae]